MNKNGVFIDPTQRARAARFFSLLALGILVFSSFASPSLGRASNVTTNERQEPELSTTRFTLVGNPNFSASQLPSEMQTWYNRLWQAINNSSQYPNANSAASSGDLYYLGRKLHAHMMGLIAAFRATGDLKLVAEIDRLMELARTQLQDWDGDGWISWRWLYDPSSAYYGNDTHQMDEILTHSMVAEVAYVLKSNAQFNSTYGTHAQFWQDYLVHTWIPKWQARGGVEKNLTYPYAAFMKFYYYLYKLTGDSSYLTEATRRANVLYGMMVEGQGSRGPLFTWDHRVPNLGDAAWGCAPTVYSVLTVMSMEDMALEGFGNWASDSYMAHYAGTFRDNVVTYGTTQLAGTLCGGDGGNYQYEEIGKYANGAAPGLAAWDTTGVLQSFNVDVYNSVEGSATPKRIYIPAYMLLTLAARSSTPVATGSAPAAPAVIAMAVPQPTAAPLIAQLAAPGTSPTSANVTNMTYFGATSIWNTPLAANATYTRETRIGTFRQTYEEWSNPIYRIAAGQTYPLVQVKNNYSGRIENWPIPTFALPSTADDHHLAVVYPGLNIAYEMWDAQWVDATHINAGGMASFPLNGSGISNPTYYRVNAAGFSTIAGMIVREDFFNASTGQYDPNLVVDHALAMSLPFAVVAPNAYISPAVGGEEAGTGGSSGIPMGALFALPKNLNVDSLNVHPYTKALLRAARDYGIYVHDTNGSVPYNNNNVGVIAVEPGLFQTMFGTSGDNMINQIQSEVYNVVAQYGIYRITAGTTTVPTATTVPQATATILPQPTATAQPTSAPLATATTIPQATATKLPQPTATAQPTSAPLATATTVPQATATKLPQPTATVQPTSAPLRRHSHSIRIGNAPVCRSSRRARL